MQRTHFIFIAALLAVFATVSLGVPTIVQAQQSPPAPQNVTVRNGTYAGEAEVSWLEVVGATSYRVGWLAVEDYAAYPNTWQSHFAYSDVVAGSTWTVRRLTPGIDYHFIVGRRYDDGIIGWSSWETLTLNADSSPCPTADGQSGTQPSQSTAGPVQGGDYDFDNDGLIDIRNLAQLDAIRYDLDGDGLLVTDADAYNAAFPRPASGSMGCPHDGCSGYELVANLTFDTNGNGQIGPGDDHWNDGAGWLPIGNSSSPFNATFHGGGFTITDLYINRAATDSVGLFGYADAGSRLQQVALVSANVTGQDYVGGLVGYNRNGGAVASSYTTGAVSGRARVGGLVGNNENTATVAGSYALGSVAGSGNTVGGLVGRNYNDATITASYATGSVSGYGFVGGLVGENDTAAVAASYATGSVSSARDYAGGLVGINNRNATVTASYATGSVSGRASYAGGLAGRNLNRSAITASYSTGPVSGNRNVNGLVYTDDNSPVVASYWDIQTSGQNESAGGEGKTTAALQSPTGYTGIYAGWNVDLDNFDLDDDLATGGDDPWDFGNASEYPRLKYRGLDVAVQIHSPPPQYAPLPQPAPNRAATDGEYDFDNDGLIDIRNLAQLDAIRYDLDGDGLLVTDADAYNAAFPRPASGSMGCPHDGCSGYELVANLTFDTNGNGQIGPGDDHWNDGAGWLPIGNSSSPFNATFHGGGFTITDLYINRAATDSVGLFGYADAGSRLQQVALVSANVTGQDYVGGLVGYNRNGGAVASSYTTGAVSGRARVGGLVGNNENTATVAGSYALGSVAGSGNTVGGLVGRNYNDATITASYATGSVSGYGFVGGLVGENDTAAVAASYATGSVSSARDYAGGLVGINNRNATVTASYATGSVSGRASYAGGLAGRNLNRSAITASYSTGPVSGNRNVNGLVYTDDNSPVVASYWDIQTSGQNESAGGEGKTTAALQSPTGYTGIYAGWNVDLDNFDLDDDLATGGDDPWDFGNASEYPRLKPTIARPHTDQTGTQTGTGPPAINSTDRAALAALYNATDGANWANNEGWLSDEPLDQWYGVATGDDGRVAILALAGNGLSGELPEELGNLTNLGGLHLQGNRLSGSIPPELGNLPEVSWLDLGRNRLSGSIPPELGNLDQLRVLDLEDNRLDGEIPGELGDLASLAALRLAGNQFTGDVPPELGGLDNLRWLDLSGNELTGETPRELGGLVNLTHLNLAGNQLGFPPGGGHPTGHTFSGEIPAELAQLHNLRMLDLSDNNLVGNIPAELGGLANLAVLNLSDNALNGNIPAELGNLASLDGLYLQRNLLSGSIPPALGKLANLRHLELSGNFLSGKIPAELFERGGAQPASKVLYVGDNRLQTTGSPQSGGLVRLQNLSLGDNRLEGEIPGQMGTLSNLRNLDLSDNRLTGEVPARLEGLTSLRSLDLRNNRLEGTIPSFLEGLVNLTFVWLEGNDFSVSCILDTLLNLIFRSDLPGCSQQSEEEEEESPVETPPTAHSADQNALRDFYDAIDDASLKAYQDQHGCSIDPYAENVDLNELCGVTRNPATGRVVKLVLRGPENQSADYRLKGTLSSALQGLSELTELDLSHNCLDGEIPSELGGLQHLTELDVSNNRSVHHCAPTGFSGILGVARGDFKGFGGTIPSSLGRLEKLANLDLSHNKLEGNVPVELGNLANLDDFRLNNNELSNGIRDTLKAFQQELYVNTRSNKWQGPDAGFYNDLEGRLSSSRELPVTDIDDEESVGAFIAQELGERAYEKAKSEGVDFVIKEITDQSRQRGAVLFMSVKIGTAVYRSGTWIGWAQLIIFDRDEITHTAEAVFDAVGEAFPVGHALARSAISMRLDSLANEKLCHLSQNDGKAICVLQDLFVVNNCVKGAGVCEQITDFITHECNSVEAWEKGQNQEICRNVTQAIVNAANICPAQWPEWPYHTGRRCN